MDLNLFTVFEAIYDEGNLTLAGQRLHLSEPAISHALRRLRDQLQDPLFIRRGKNMIPTPLSRNIIEDVHQSLKALELTLQETHFEPTKTRRVYRLAMRDLLECAVLPPLACTFQKFAPGAKIASVKFDRDHAESDLASGAIDLLIDVPFPVSEKTCHEPLCTESLIVASRQNHPSIRDTLDLTTYLSQGHVLVSARREGAAFVDFELSRHGKRRDVRIRCQDYFAACQIVSQTDLLVTMPEHCARAMNAPFKNQLYPFPVRASSMNFQLYWHAAIDADESSCWLRRQIKEIFRERIRGPKKPF
jgi:DNA-binding transcriptional LysR family regulator